MMKFAIPLNLSTMQQTFSTMAQVSIREYDAKRLYADFSGNPYTGTLIQSARDFAGLEDEKTYIIKPDQLFGKRGKYGLVGVGLSPQEAQDWWNERHNTTATIGKSTGTLHTFLVEDFIPHTEEYYAAIKTERDHDILYFSTA